MNCVSHWQVKLDSEHAKLAKTLKFAGSLVVCKESDSRREYSIHSSVISVYD